MDKEETIRWSTRMEVNRMTLLERYLINQRRQRAALNACIDRHAIKTGACQHCPWHTTGAACVLPRCFKPSGSDGGKEDQ